MKNSRDAARISTDIVCPEDGPGILDCENTAYRLLPFALIFVLPDIGIQIIATKPFVESATSANNRTVDRTVVVGFPPLNHRRQQGAPNRVIKRKAVTKQDDMPRAGQRRQRLIRYFFDERWRRTLQLRLHELKVILRMRQLSTEKA